MIWGVVHKDASHGVSEETLRRMVPGDSSGMVTCMHHPIGLAYRESYPGECRIHEDNGRGVSVLFQGAVYNVPEIIKRLKESGDATNPARLVALLYLKHGEDFVQHLRGKFCFALYDGKQHTTVLGRDRLGVESLFIHEDEEKLVFGSSVFPVVRHPGIQKRCNYQAVYYFLLACYNPSSASFFEGIDKLRPGHLHIHHNGRSRIKRYWSLSFASKSTDDENKIAEHLLSLLKDSVRCRMDSRRTPGVFVSGGLDSSTVLALARESYQGGIHTFSYRCRGESFDESPYARLVSEHYRTHHTLVEYPSDAVQTIQDLVIRMDEPFCDLGINIATDILGKASSGTVAYALTGDGGDELFGGHPVYLADGAGRMMDRVPGLFKRPFLWAGLKLRDTDKKKDFRVKWKRFSYSMQFPSSLLSHRWRVYYTPGELQSLVQADYADRLLPSDPYEAFLSVNGEADGEAFLDRALYSDYQTVVGFYLRRMDLIRQYGIESRFPLLDHGLVEYGATIPPHLKIRGNSDTKYILKQTMKDILPHEIVFRKDKLGHSIPMKNWMREAGYVQSMLMELCSPERLKKRGLFQAETVKQYIDEHVSKRRNHSHRLWALMVLELWFQHHMDG